MEAIQRATLLAVLDWAWLKNHDVYKSNFVINSEMYFALFGTQEKSFPCTLVSFKIDLL